MSQQHRVKKGDLVEFSDRDESQYVIGGSKARYGVATSDEFNFTVEVETVKGKERVPWKRVHAASWNGWIPPELEAIVEKYSDEDFNDGRYDE